MKGDMEGQKRKKQEDKKWRRIQAGVLEEVGRKLVVMEKKSICKSKP